MKLLTLTCNTGQGHNSCAAAVDEEFRRRGGQTVIVDALSLVSEKASELTARVHEGFYLHMPKLYGKCYDMAGKLKSDAVPMQMKSDWAEKLRSLAADCGAILCTHVFPAQMISSMRMEGIPLPPAAFLATDYTCSPMVGTCDVDVFFIPHPDLKEEFISAGVPAEKLLPVGIPVRRAFTPCEDKAQAKVNSGLRPDELSVLMMGGSMGCGPMEELALALSSALFSDGTVTVVCGSNRKLYETLERAERPNIRLLGYTENVPELMDAADVLLTKAGGISITEAAAKRLPLVLVSAVGGCESKNLDFFTERGWAVTAEDPQELVWKTVSLLKTEPALLRASAALTDVPPGAAERIADTLEKASGEK